LGKVLYEISTGLDRNEFPKVPSLGDGSQIDPREFSELNEVLLKACDPSPHSRYRTAEELLSDLLWIRDGKSLCRLRSRQRRTALFWKSSATAAVIVLSAIGFHRTISSVQHLATQAGPSNLGGLRAEMQKVEELFQRDEADGALACLARLVRADPSNRGRTPHGCADLEELCPAIPGTDGLGRAAQRHPIQRGRRGNHCGHICRHDPILECDFRPTELEGEAVRRGNNRPGSESGSHALRSD
jgi:hypothetical protein